MGSEMCIRDRGEGYAAWQKAKLPRLRLGVPDGTELAKEMDELIKGESKA